MNKEMNIRKAEQGDLEAINEIYNYEVLHASNTFDTEIKTMEERKTWWEDHERTRSPVIVGVLTNDDKVIGWASISQFSERLAYAETGEISEYLAKEYRGNGYGKKLTEAIIEEGRRSGLHSLIAKITAENELSIRLHQSFGFQIVGILKEVGKKFDKRLDVTIMQYIYK